jgi:hypothetical protein
VSLLFTGGSSWEPDIVEAVEMEQATECFGLSALKLFPKLAEERNRLVSRTLPPFLDTFWYDEEEWPGLDLLSRASLI